MNMETALKAEGYGVITAENGRDAIDLARRERPDLIIMDGMMPDMDGFTACRHIKDDPVTANINIIFLTAKDMTTDMVKGLDSGAMDYITKPFKYDELFARLRSFQRLYSYQKKLSAMVEFSSAINQLDIQKLVAEIQKNLTGIIRVELFSIFLYDEKLRQVALLVSNHPHLADSGELELDIDQTPLMRDVVEQKRVIHISEFSKSPYLTGQLAGQREKYSDDYAIGVPLIMGHRLIGVMNLNGNSHGFFEKPDFTFIQLAAEHIASAISNAMQYRRIQEMAVTDALTGVFNRRHFFEQLVSEWERYDRYNSVLSIIMADIDFFKKINDTWGHPCGDVVLAQTAKILKSHLRKVDTVARYGGEEFVILLPETSAEAAAMVAERMRADIATHPFMWDGKPISATISLGVADATEEGATAPDFLLRNADQKLYKAKESGRNVVIR